MFNTNEKIIKHKVGSLNLTEEPGNAIQNLPDGGRLPRCLFRYKPVVEKGDVEALFGISRARIFFSSGNEYLTRSRGNSRPPSSYSIGRYYCMQSARGGRPAGVHSVFGKVRSGL